MRNLLFPLMAVFLLPVHLIAQEAPKVRFEKVSVEELSMKTYPNDTTAEAVILFDDGNSNIVYENGKGFILTHDRFIRIKILKQSGVSWGNFNIALYSSDLNREEMTTTKGSTFNLENGKIIKSELKKNGIFNERENRYWETVRLSMPSVKVGSVIDLKYSIKSNLTWNLRTWKFQYPIPVKWSQYRVVYPEYYTYNQTSMGYHPLLYAKKDQQSININYTTTESNPTGLQSGASERVSHSISYLTQIFEYAANNVPAIKAEPYLTSLSNYTTLIKFELANTNFIKAGGRFQNYTTSWIDIAKQLRDNESFGLQLRNAGFVEDAVAELTKGTTDEMEKLQILYNHVQHTMKWDGFKSAFTSKSLKKAYAEKTGNSADINLLLTVMLNKAGISAFPVILSTRENGILSIVHATISDCNYVLVQAMVNGKPVLLDATESNLQAGLIPFRCLNGKGHLIINEESETVQLLNPKSVKNTTVVLEIKEGKMTGTIQKKVTGLTAFNFRESVKLAGGLQEHFEKIKNSSSEIDFTEYQCSKLDSLYLPAYIDYKFVMKEAQNSNAGIIYIDPVLTDRQKDNPFTSPSRDYPVDFGAPFTEIYNLQLTIPAGYAIEELPKNKSMVLPDKGGQFQYEVNQVGNIIVVGFRLSIDKTLFIPSEYQALKNFYNLVINKQAEQIILKKIIN